jgi:hypothetical protein
VPVTTIESLITLGLTVFTQVFTLFKNHGLPVTQAGTVTNQLNATPGATPAHQAVVTAAVGAAVTASQPTPTA